MAPLSKCSTWILSNTIQQKGVFSQSLHLSGNDILQLQPATQRITLGILKLNSIITAFVIFIKTIITWTCTIYSSYKRLLLHFLVIKYETRNAKIYHSDNMAPFHLQLHIGKAHHKKQCLLSLITSHKPGAICYQSQSVPYTEDINLVFHGTAKLHYIFQNHISPVLPGLLSASGGADNVLLPTCRTRWGLVPEGRGNPHTSLLPMAHSTPPFAPDKLLLHRTRSQHKKKLMTLPSLQAL